MAEEKGFQGVRAYMVTNYTHFEKSAWILDHMALLKEDKRKGFAARGTTFRTSSHQSIFRSKLQSNQSSLQTHTHTQTNTHITSFILASLHTHNQNKQTKQSQWHPHKPATAPPPPPPPLNTAPSFKRWSAQ